jgi:hypothetical protein
MTASIIRQITVPHNNAMERPRAGGLRSQGTAIGADMQHVTLAVDDIR